MLKALLYGQSSFISLLTILVRNPGRARSRFVCSGASQSR
ncbi:hypothetical protein MC7420_3437 [Coleofasciculus chthonoplastes PCC 7420]|uniref:Uncharacterized protein n=1 Tax=Coleofasciculus chthonoplastes PCC 7420 TaxID=118168 RepID=B4W3G0_9CYAN|nr:hypothetical protein MC7420_3437 [Coleofasciculus chthonoplastes PCC 7420]